MRPNVVVVEKPVSGLSPRFEDTDEAMHIEDFVSGFSVERFDVGVLRRLARLDEVQNDVAFGSPAQHRVARKLQPIVKSQNVGQTTLESDSLPGRGSRRAIQTRS